MNEGNGKLYIVSTPIGNLSDITFRAIDTLKSVDLILAEDTRNTSKLLNAYEIENKVVSYHEHNKYEKVSTYLNYLLSGKNIAIVSDAGTPLISDPGDVLVKKAIENDICVLSIPGPSALISAITVSGLDLREFVFLGFLSDKKNERIKKLKDNKFENKTMIIYISPHKFNRHMEDIINVFGEDRKASLSRELTKMHEETYRGSLKSIYDKYKDSIKGELVLCVSGINDDDLKKEDLNKWSSMTLKEHIDYYIDLGFDEKESMKKVAKDRSMQKREVYKTLKQI